MNTTTSPSTPSALAGAPGRRAGWSLVLVAASLWGTTGLAFKALGANSDSNAWAISFLRLALSVPFILLCARIVLGRWLPTLSCRGLLVLLGVGAGMALYQITYVLAIERVGVSISVLISICGAPVFVAFIARTFMKEPLKARTYFALVTAVVGTFLLVGYPRGPDVASPRFWEGVAIAVACAVFQAFFVLAARAAGKVCHPMHSVGVGFTLGALLLLPFALHFGLSLRYSGMDWAMLLYLGAVPTALAQTFFLSGLKSTGAVGGAIASLLEPLVSTVLAVAFLGEQLGSVGYLGAAILLIGLLIS